MKLSVVFSQQDLNALSQLLIERAEHIISNPAGEEKFYVSGCQAFLFFMKRDSARMQKRIPIILGSVLEKDAKKLTPPKCKWNMDAFVYNKLLGYKDSKYGSTGMMKHNVEKLRLSSILHCLTTKNIFLMWCGPEYPNNLCERISYIRCGNYSKAPVGLEELGIPYDDYYVNNEKSCYNLNSLMFHIYDEYLYGLSEASLEKLQSVGLISSNLKIALNDAGLVYRSHNKFFAYAYPVNFIADALYLPAEDVANYYSEILAFAEFAFGEMAKDYGTDYIDLLKYRYADNMTFEQIGSLMGISGNRVSQKRKNAIRYLRFYHYHYPKAKKPWVSSQVVTSYRVEEQKRRAEQEKVIKENEKREALAHERVNADRAEALKTPFANIHLYGEHLKVDKELLDTNAREDYIYNFLTKARECGANDVFLADKFHQSYYSLCSISQLSDWHLSYADCKLLEQFIGCNKRTFLTVLNNMIGCNYENFEGLNFGLTSLLVQSGLVKKSEVSRWVLRENELPIPAEDVKLVYGPYIFVPNGMKRSPAFEKCLKDMYCSDADSRVLTNYLAYCNNLSKEERNYYSSYRSAHGYKPYKDLDDIPVKTLVTDRLNSLWRKLGDLGFRSLNAVGFYLMNGMEGYFETLSKDELGVLKFILDRLGIYEYPKK